MSDVKDVAPVTTEAVVADRGIGSRKLPTLAMLMALGWLGTNLGLNIGEFPLKFLLKDKLHCDAAAVSAFFAIGAITNYVKPLAGVMVDGVPLFRTRRRWYLIGSLLLTGLLWLLMAYVPKTYNSLLLTYGIMYVTVVFTSTSLGGVMVEVGHRFNAAGRLTSQRIGCFRLANLLSGRIAGYLTQHYPFI
ncbi:MAG: folate transporter, partial [Chthonomonadales bacterium]|nr:folate transporter [Chthonomonadales bacterium]